MRRAVAWAQRTVKRFAHGIVRFEHPFHVAYLAGGTAYYTMHGIFPLAACSGGLCVIVLAHYLGGDNG
jgi:hypothetical protein